MNADCKNHFRAVQREQRRSVLAHESTLVGSPSIPEMHNSASVVRQYDEDKQHSERQGGHDETARGDELPKMVL